MVTANIKNLEDVLPRLKFNENLIKGLEFIQNLDTTLPDGRVDIEGDNLFASIATAKTEDPEDRFYESHKDYIDIQYVFEGMQQIFWLPTSYMGDKVCDENYELENELYKYENINESYANVVLGKGNFVIFYPQDAHKCLCRYEDYKEVRVCVVKVKVR